MRKIIPLIVLLLIIGGVFVYKKFMPKKFEIEQSQTGQTKHSIPLNEILDGGPGKDGIPSIDHPKFISVTSASSQFNRDGLGLVVSLNGEDRFYPYQILVWHELVNDQIGSTPILVSFCPLCGSGIVFERKLDGQGVEFGVSGKLYNSDLLMYDRKTESLWSQILGEAVVGDLTGAKLKQLPADVLPFKLFAQKFPQGQVLSKDTGFGRDYERSPYGNYDRSDQLYFPVSQQDNRLFAKTRVVGIEVSNQYKAYPIDLLKQKGEIKDSLAGHELLVTYNAGAIKITDQTTRQELVPTYTFWFGWFAFHPNTKLYSGGNQP